MLSLDHIGWAVEDASEASELAKKLLGSAPYLSESVPDQGVRVHFLPAGPPGAASSALELLETHDPDSPVGRFLARRGEGLHHLAFTVEDAEAAIKRARDLGLRPLSDEPRAGAGGKRIVFLHPRDTCGALIELCEHRSRLPDPTPVPYEQGTLAAYVLGRPDAPALLLLHGAAGSTERETAALAHRLAPHFRIIALDFAGHGASDTFSGEAFSADLFVRNIGVTLEHLSIEQAHLFGFSMGGYMALSFAHAHPERVRRLAVHGTCLAWNDDLVQRMVGRLEPRTPTGPEKPAVQDSRAELLHRTARFVRTLPAHSDAMRAQAETIDQPTLVSSVDRDDLFPLSTPIELHRRLPNSRLAVLPGARHALGQLDLSAFVPLLARHLRAS